MSFSTRQCWGGWELLELGGAARCHGCGAPSSWHWQRALGVVLVLMRNRDHQGYVWCAVWSDLLWFLPGPAAEQQCGLSPLLQLLSPSRGRLLLLLRLWESWSWLCDPEPDCMWVSLHCHLVLSFTDPIITFPS